MAGVSLAFAAMLVLAGYFLLQSRAMLHDRADNNAQTITHVLEQFVFTAIHEPEVLLQIASDEYRRELQAGRYDPKTYTDYLTYNRKRIPAIANLRVTDAAGRISYGENGLLDRPADISDRPYFAAARDGNNKLTISPPVLGKISLEWVIPVARRLEGPNGRFDGLLIANLQSKVFTEVFASLGTDPNSVFVLFDADAGINLRYPEPKGPGSSIGLKIGSPEFLALWQQGVRAATYRGQSTTDGIWRTYSYRQVGDYPLYVMFGVAESDIMAPLKTQAAITAVGLLILGVLLAVLWALQRGAISNQHQAAVVLQESEARLRTIIENEPECIKIVDAQGRLLQMNPAGLAMIEADSEQQVVGQPVADVIAPEYRSAFAEMHRRVLGGETALMEFEVLGLKGGRRWLETHAVPMQQHGETVHLAVTRDISERKQSEAALTEKTRELLRSNRELEQFSYSISHDMRQPLRMISSYLQLLQKSLGDSLDAQKREYFQFAIDGAKRMDTMMLGLLEYSRVGRKGEPPAWVESRKVLNDALLFLGPLIDEAQAEFRIEGDWPRVLVSPDEMLRLLQNLIGNALKFRVAERLPVITISSSASRSGAGGLWQVCIADNGVGIAPDQIGRLFQVFQRLQSRAAYEGNGIGLALCRKIAEHHGGRIWALSEGEGLGSRFYVEIPLRQDESRAIP